MASTAPVEPAWLGVSPRQRRCPRGCSARLQRPLCALESPEQRRDARRTVAMPRRRGKSSGGGSAEEASAAPRPPDGPSSLRRLGGGSAALLAALLLSRAPPETVSSLAATLAEFTRHFVLGGFAAAVGTAAVYPLDLIKTRMQVEPSRYSSALACGADAVTAGGFTALYAGMGAQLLGVAPEKSFKIMAYNACHAALLSSLGFSHTANLPFSWEALAGAAAGAAQTMVACPLEAAKIPLQMETVSGGAPKKLAAVLSELGISGLYRGLDVCLARDVATSAIFFSCFAAAKHLLGDWSGESAASSSFLLKLTAGALAGVPSALLTTPLDVVKTRLQAQAADAERPYQGTWDCARRTVQEEGWRALTCGAGERVARLSPQLGITLALYEVLDPIR